MLLGSHLSFQVLSLLVPLLCHKVAANTEIINFSTSRERTVDLPLAVVGNWSNLHRSDNERQWSLEPAALHTPLHQVCEQDDTTVSSHRPFSCPHELWLFLDLDDEKWTFYSTFTLRLSWPASTPADFSIEIYSPETVLARISKRHQISTGPENTHANANANTNANTNTNTDANTNTNTRSSPHTPTTRSKYARIRAINAGFPTPNSNSQSQSQPQVSSSSSLPHPDSDAPANLAVKRLNNSTIPIPIPFILILEPLHLGVLPASLLPTVGFLIPILLVAALSVSRVIAYLDTFVRQAREDLTNNNNDNNNRSRSSRTALEKKDR